MTDVALLQLQRCDACCAKGMVHVELISGLDLMFCGHHYDKFAATLVPLALNVEDERVEVKEEVEVSVQ